MAGRDSFFFRDFAIFSYPLAAYHKACFWEGQLPLWNPYNDCGVPFLAQWNTMVLYPLTLIYLLFPLPWSLNFFCLFHFWLGGLGMYFLARAWTRHPSAATLAGLAFLFSGVVLSCLKWPNNIAALGWMPWVVWCTDRALVGNLRALGIACLVGASQMLTGAPEIIVLTWGAVFALGTHRIVSEQTNILKRFGKLLTLTGLVAAYSAAQLLPFLDLLQHSQRDSAFLGSQWPMPPWGWANFLLPLFRMFPSYHDVHAQPGQYWISTYYVSIGVVWLAILALGKVRNGRIWVLGGLLIFSMWMALGDRGLLYKCLRATVPGLGMMRYPIKFVVLAAFTMPLLGAFGLKEILSGPKPSPKTLWIPASLLAAVIGGLIIYSELNPFRYSRAFLTTTNGAWRILFLLGTAATLAAITRGSKFDRKWGVLIIWTLLTIDGLSHTSWQNPVAPSWVYAGAASEMNERAKLGRGRVMISPEAAETVDHLKLDNPAEDVLASRTSLYCNMNLLERVPKVDGFFAIYPKAMAQLQDEIYRGTNLPPQNLLDFMGVTYVTRAGTWNQWEHRETAQPLITAPRNVQQGSGTVAEVLTSRWSPTNEVMIASTGPIECRAVGAAEIELAEWKPHRIQATVNATGESTIVLAQTFYHCWKATIDGVPTEIARANAAFQALAVPAGKHEVVLVYSDASFALGVGITLGATVLVCLLLAFPHGLKRLEHSAE